MGHPMRVALIGFGAIGQQLARCLLEHRDRIEIVAVLTNDLGAGLEVTKEDLESLRGCITDQFQTCLECRPELIVECAGHEAVDAYAQATLAAGCDLLLVSVGALADEARLTRVREAADRSGRQVLLVAGAIGGTDWLQAAHRAGLEDVVYRGRKPPCAWKGSPAEQLSDLDTLTEATRLFSGTALEAAQCYPRNANVAATIALATRGMNRTRVELWADPAVRENCHEVEAWGAAGHFWLRLENQPDPANPRTSMVTAYSALCAILDRRAAISL